jgi:hypothetical protein
MKLNEPDWNTSYTVTAGKGKCISREGNWEEKCKKSKGVRRKTSRRTHK